MRLPYVTLLLLASVISARIIDSSAELICPSESPLDCYPQLFEPTNQWQVVREGQQIPPGLHVRVNLETGLEEARLLQQDDLSNAEVVLVDTDTDKTPELDLNSDEVKQKLQETINEYRERKKAFSKNKISHADLTDFDLSVNEIVGYQPGDSTYRLEQALSTLSELGHDIEFGAKLADNAVIIHSMTGLAEEMLSSTEKISNPINVRLAELIYRVIGSSLRNNPEAVEAALDKQPVSFVDGLFSLLSDLKIPDVIKKRALGIVQALAANKNFAYRYFNDQNISNAQGLHNLITVFPSLGASSQVRAANILNDLNLLPRAEKREEFDESNVAREVSKYIQSYLSGRTAVPEEQMQVYFRSLLDLHSKGDYPVSKEFLQWLSKESENRKSSLRERDSDLLELSFDGLLLRARHGIFGNPYARKDEL